MALSFDLARELVTEKIDEIKDLFKNSLSPETFLSCKYPNYFKNKMTCKHMYLVARVFDIFEIRYEPDPELLR
ncbi:hypothetical protein BGZ58_003287, partial [Dissophora ornata]